jgi:hypothetical protein
MENEKSLVAFEKYKIRRYYDEKLEIWYFSVIDVVAALTDSFNPRDYWFKMKIRVKTEDGIELSTICRQLKLTSADGKKYATDCANAEGLLRIIQSIPFLANYTDCFDPGLYQPRSLCRQKGVRGHDDDEENKYCRNRGGGSGLKTGRIILC